MKRPWNGAVEDPFDFASIPRHDIKNPLCPRATRGGKVTNPDYKETFIFDNDFPSLNDSSPQPTDGTTGLPLGSVVYLEVVVGS